MVKKAQFKTEGARPQDSRMNQSYPHIGGVRHMLAICCGLRVVARPGVQQTHNPHTAMILPIDRQIAPLSCGVIVNLSEIFAGRPPRGALP